MHRQWCSFVFVVCGLVFPKVSATGYEQPFCTDLKPQNTLDLGQIMGMWYGVEIIPHLREEDGVIVYDTCPVIHLSETTYEPEGSRGQYGRSGNSGYLMTTDSYVRPGDYGYNWNTGSYGGHDYRDRDYRHLRLYWDEAGNNIEYSLKFNTSRRGFWVSSGPQNGQTGTLLQRQYNQFAGTVQVMKAVGDHLVLTFCQRLPESQLFSVILSREPQQLGRQVVHSIHNLLNRRDLSTSAVRKVCRNGAPNADAFPISMVAFTVISLISYFGAERI